MDLTQTLPQRGVFTAPRPAIDILVARHGAWRVLYALLSALVGPRTRTALDVAHLPPHLQRDLGLQVDPPSPRHWDIGL